MEIKSYEITIKPATRDVDKLFEEYCEALDKACLIDSILQSRLGVYLPEDIFEQIVNIINK